MYYKLLVAALLVVFTASCGPAHKSDLYESMGYSLSTGQPLPPGKSEEDVCRAEYALAGAAPEVIEKQCGEGGFWNATNPIHWYKSLTEEDKKE